MPSNANAQGWFSRNWKWVVPVGCLGVVALLVAFVASILLIVTGAIRSSDAYQIAMSRARANPEVVAALGEPIEVGWLLTGNINVNGPSGEANLSVPLEGPNGSGTLYIVADKIAGEWVFERMEVELEGSGDRVNLMEESERMDLG